MYFSICKDLRGDFKVYSTCHKCLNIYLEAPAISRIDNKTKICSNYSMKEALKDFIK